MRNNNFKFVQINGKHIYYIFLHMKSNESKNKNKKKTLKI